MSIGSNSKHKQTQRDYNMSFKLVVVSQVEKGELTYKQAQRQYGIQGRGMVLVWLRKHNVTYWANSMMTMPRFEDITAQK